MRRDGLLRAPKPGDSGQFAESAKLEKAIKANLKGLGYGG
jgi:hypothetical protein